MEEEIFEMLTFKPPISKSNDYINKLYKEHKEYFDRATNTTDKSINYKDTEDRKPIKVALFSDLHIDYDYQEGMNNDCGKPICCRSDSGLPKTD